VADNSTLNAGAGGDTYRSKDRAGIKTQIVGLDINVTGSEVLAFGTSTYGMAVDVKRDLAAGTSALTNLSSSAASQTALAANADRLGMTFVNDVDKSCYLKYGATASVSSFTHKLLPGEQWEPKVNYTGRVDVIWDTGPTGSLRITELTA